MKIGIIGSGNIGGTAAKLFVNAGHDVAISNSRGPESLTSFVNSVGPNIKAKTVEDAIKFGDVTLLAIPWRKRQNLLSVSGLFNSKIVIDAMNPYSEKFEVIDLGNSTSSEEVLKLIPSSRLVKAFNTIYYEHLGTKGNPDASKEDRFAIFVAGDDFEAKATVSKLIEDIGFAPIDTGSLKEGGRKQQPGSPIYNNPMTAKVAYARLSEIA
ncbi:MAG TPA: NADPH-dependent F420 reductase [Nitrososphaeraceae archaeon]|nr:NADPH-dependent F420 reductase [Nitrososphaeraceae archaeon]